MVNEQVEIEFLGKDKVTSVMKKITSKAKSTSSNIKKSWSSASLAVKAAWAAVGYAIVRVFQDIIRLTMEAELAQARMVQQFENVGIASERNIKAINALANEIQKKTLLSNDEVISSAALAASYKLNGKQIETLLPALADLTAFTRKSTGQMSQMEDSVKLMGYVLEGQVGRLKLLGITMSDYQKEVIATGTSSERLAVFIEAVNQNAGGLAESMGGTASGSVIQFKNEIDDLKKSIGGDLLPAFAGFLKGVSGFIKLFKTGLEAIGRGMAQIVIGFQASKMLVTEGWSEAQEFVKQSTENMNQSLINNVDEIWGWSEATAEATGNVDDAIQETSINYESLQDSVRELDKARKDALVTQGIESQLYKTLNKEYQEAATKLDEYNKVLGANQVATDQANQANQKTVNLTANQAVMLADRLEKEKALMEQYIETGGETGIKAEPVDIVNMQSALNELKRGGEVTSEVIQNKVGLMNKPFITVTANVDKTAKAIDNMKVSYDVYVQDLVNTEAVELAQYVTRLELLQQMAIQWQLIRDLKQQTVNIQAEDEDEDEEPEEDTNP